MKWALPWLIPWARRASTMDFCPVQHSTKYYFPHRTLFHFISPHRPATWAGSRAGSPVSVSLVSTVSEQ